MATPTLTLLNHQLLTTADTSTGWADLVTADADIKVEGANSMSGIFRANNEQGYYDAGAAPVTAAGKTFRGWILTNNLPYMGTLAANPYELLAFDGTTTEKKPLFGSDTYNGGWFNIIWDMNDFTTLTLANVRRWGVEAGHALSAKNVVNSWMDVQRYLDGYAITGGTTGDRVRLQNVVAVDKPQAYWIVFENNEVYFATGTLQIGNGATSTFFEMNGQILVFVEYTVRDGLYVIRPQGSGCTVNIVNSVIRATGSSVNTRVDIDLDDPDFTLEAFTGNLIVRGGTLTARSGQNLQNNSFDNCETILANGADLRGSLVKRYEGAANTSSLLWNVATDPIGLLDNTEFTKGTAATHAIEFGPTSPLSMTLSGVAFSGYNALNNQNDSAIHIKRTTGTVDISVVGGGTSPSYRTDGAIVNIILPSQVLTINGVPTGAEYRLYVEDPAVGKIGSTELQGTESWTGGTITYNYTWTSDVNVVLQVIEPGFVESLTYFTLTENSQTINVVLEQETNT